MLPPSFPFQRPISLQQQQQQQKPQQADLWTTKQFSLVTLQKGLLFK